MSTINIPRYTIIYGVKREDGIAVKNNNTEIFFDRFKLPTDCFSSVVTTNELYNALMRVFSTKKNTQIWKVIPFKNEHNMDMKNINIDKNIFKEYLKQKGYTIVQCVEDNPDEDFTELNEEDRLIFQRDILTCKNAREFYLKTISMYETATAKKKEFYEAKIKSINEKYEKEITALQAEVAKELKSNTETLEAIKNANLKNGKTLANIDEEAETYISKKRQACLDAKNELTSLKKEVYTLHKQVEYLNNKIRLAKADANIDMQNYLDKAKRYEDLDGQLKKEKEQLISRLTDLKNKFQI